MPSPAINLISLQYHDQERKKEKTIIIIIPTATDFVLKYKIRMKSCLLVHFLWCCTFDFSLGPFDRFSIYKANLAKSVVIIWLLN